MVFLRCYNKIPLVSPGVSPELPGVHRIITWSRIEYSLACWQGLLTMIHPFLNLLYACIQAWVHCIICADSARTHTHRHSLTQCLWSLLSTCMSQWEACASILWHGLHFECHLCFLSINAYIGIFVVRKPSQQKGRFPLLNSVEKICIACLCFKFYVEKYFNCDIEKLWFCRNMCNFV